MSQEFSTLGESTITLTMLVSDTATIVADGSKFPADGPFYVLVEDELILVTARSGGNMTLNRAQDGTTAVQHASGSTMKLVLNKKAFTDFFDERILKGTAASLPSTANNGQRYYATDIDLAWLRNGGNWDLIRPCYIPYANRVDVSGWTAFNHGSSTWTTVQGTLTAALPTGSDNLRGYFKAKPSAPFTINAIVRPGATASQFTMTGLGFYDGTKLATISLMGFNTIEGISVDRYNSVTSWNSNQWRQSEMHQEVCYLRIEDDNTNWTFYTSHNGKQYQRVAQYARNTFLTPTSVCLFANRATSSPAFDSHHYFLAYWET